MDYFDNLKDIKDLSNQVEQEREMRSEELLEEAISLMSDFKESRQKNLLINASELFFESIKYKRTNPSPYVWLAYIFYILDKKENTIKYIKLASMFKSKDPMLDELKKMMGMNFPPPVPKQTNSNLVKPGGFIKQLKLLKSSFSKF